MEKPIRVLHVLQRMEAAGVQTLLMSIYRNIDRSKVQFDFLVHYKEEQFFDKEVEALGGRIYKFSVREDHNVIKYLRELKDFFYNHPEYKIVHGHMPVLGLFYLKAAYKAGVQTRIAHAHTDRSYNSVKGYISSVMKRLYPVFANHYFACSQSAGNHVFKNKNFEIIKNAIMTERFVYNEQKRLDKRQELNINDKLVVGHAGRFAEHKNHAFLIDVFSEIVKIRPDSVLLLIGGGELKEEIKQKVKLLNLEEKVKFMGIRADVNELYQAMDVFVFPSIFEGLGIVNIEAQASGVLTVCSTAVPDEANISPNYMAISLDEPAENWARMILERVQAGVEREKADKYVVEAGYDAKTLAKRMQNFYLDEYSKHIE